MNIQSLLEHISIIPDLRQQGKIRHELTDIFQADEDNGKM